MKRAFWLVVVLFAFCGKQTNCVAQTFLPDSETKVYFEAGKPTVQLVIHPVIGVIPTPLGNFNAAFAEYDVFATTNPAANQSKLDSDDWLWIRRTRPGETNLVIKNVWPKKPTFVFASIGDADNDNLPDTFEILVSKTNPHKYDSANDGVSDGDKMGPNGLPWKLEQDRRTSVVIFANTNKAMEGGACGQCTVYLPAPAPAGGETVKYYLGGMASPERDFTITPSSGTWNSYSLNIPTGSDKGVIFICAKQTKRYFPYDRYVDITLTGSKAYPICSFPAEVSIFNNNLPNILVYALPTVIDAPLRVYGTNQTVFEFCRGGNATNAVTIDIELNGTRPFWKGRTNAKGHINFPAGERTRLLPVTLKQYKVDKPYDSITLKITSAPGYQIDPTNGSASIQIVNHDFIFQQNIQH